MPVPEMAKNGFNSFFGVQVTFGRLDCKWKSGTG
jgi:hypothetical protein